MRVELSKPPSAQSPFARGGCYPLTGRPPKSPQRTLLLLPCSYGLMRQTKSLPAPRWSLVRRVLAGCHQSLLGDGPSRHYLCNPCVGAWTHTPPRLSSALAQFLPREHRPHATEDAFGTRNCPCNATSTGSRISGLQSFDYLQAPTLARPPDCIHRSTLVLGGRAVYTTHRPGGYPFRDVASLRVRLGQLTRLDLHQLDCSLVGCSFPHTASQWSLESPHYANPGYRIVPRRRHRPRASKKGRRQRTAWPGRSCEPAR